MIAIATALIQSAAPVEPAPTSDEIVVTAPADPFAISTDRLRRAIAAFDKDRGRLAPRGRLLFELRPRDSAASRDGLAIWLSDGKAVTPVAADDLGRFQLPSDLPAGWTLRANRRGSTLALRALVRTPGFEDTKRRMGDLRLHCRVNWAVQGDRYSFVQRAAFATVGGCDTRRIAFFFGEPRPLAGATLRDKALPIGKDGRSFFAPIGLKTVSDDETIALAFR